jgi:hypothetical protein
MAEAPPHGTLAEVRRVLLGHLQLTKKQTTWLPDRGGERIPIGHPEYLRDQFKALRVQIGSALPPSSGWTPSTAPPASLC